MIKKCIFFVFSFMPLFLAAQIAVSVQLPSAGMIQKDQLWNLLLVNNTNDLFEASVSLNLQDAVTGQTVLSASSRTIFLGRGIKSLGIRDLEPVQYNYLSADIAGNYIPLGSYVACYRIIKNGTKPEPVADECVRVIINPLSPPQLNTPADKEVLTTPYPMLTWVPPSPAAMFNNLNYAISIAEVGKGQSPADAVLYNVPVYSTANIRNTFQNYPPGYSSLQPGKLYAWQVKANNGFNYSAQTEVWTFTIQADDSAKIVPADAAYIVLQSNPDRSGVNYISDKNLLIKYYSFDKGYETVVSILTDEGKVMQEIKQKIVYGDNFLLFRLNHFFQKGKVYRVQIAGQENAVYSTRFSIKPSKQPN